MHKGLWTVKTAQIWKQSQVAIPFPTWLVTGQKRWCNSSFVFESELKKQFLLIVKSMTAADGEVVVQIQRFVYMLKDFDYSITEYNQKCRPSMFILPQWHKDKLKKTNVLLMSLPCLDNICFTTANCVIHLVLAKCTYIFCVFLDSFVNLHLKAIATKKAFCTRGLFKGDGQGIYRHPSHKDFPRMCCGGGGSLWLVNWDL